MVESKTAVGVGEARGRDFTRHEGTKLHAGVRHRTSIQGENIARESAFIPRFTDKLSYARECGQVESGYHEQKRYPVQHTAHLEKGRSEGVGLKGRGDLEDLVPPL